MKILFNGAAEERLNSTTITLGTDTLQSRKIRTMRDVLEYLYVNHAETHNSYFDERGRVADGILCVINDQDWEITGAEESEVTEEDEITIISSLHGG
jgi:ubiquitin related modifier 1